MSRKYKVVGWYVDQPTDELSTPYAIVVYVRAANRSMAFDDGEVELRKIMKKRGSYNLLNWFVEEVKA